MDILVFGQLREVVGHSIVPVEQALDSDQMLKQLMERYPMLKNYSFRIAVDGKMINGNVPLVPGMSIALFPPFSGG